MNPAAIPMSMFGLTQPRKPQEAFLWGRGGRRMSIDDIELQRRIAAQEQADAGSGAPVGHWLQGLNRSLGAVTGGVRMSRANRAESERAAEAKAKSDAVLEALLDPAADRATILRGVASGDKGVSSVAGLLAEPMFAKPGAPHYWETNDGSLGMVGPDGKPVVLYKDPTPKVTYITADNPDGTKQLIPVVNGQVQGGGGQTSGAPAGPPATLPPDFDFGDEGGPASAPGGFPYADY